MGNQSYPHPPRGTCFPGCGLYGLCHCLCGEKTAICPRSSPSRGYVKGRPSVYRAGHNRHDNSPGAWGTKGIPVTKVKPLLEFIDRTYPKFGKWTLVGNEIGLCPSTLRTYLSEVRKGTEARMMPVHAEQLARFVLAHRRPADPFADNALRRPALRVEQREAENAERRAYRHGKRKENKFWVDIPKWNDCACGRKKQLASDKCQTCHKAKPRVWKSA